MEGSAAWVCLHPLVTVDVSKQRTHLEPTMSRYLLATIARIQSFYALELAQKENRCFSWWLLKGDEA
jgi:hypothetical protein